MAVMVLVIEPMRYWTSASGGAPSTSPRAHHQSSSGPRATPATSEGNRPSLCRRAANAVSCARVAGVTVTPRALHGSQSAGCLEREVGIGDGRREGLRRRVDDLDAAGAQQGRRTPAV